MTRGLKRSINLIVIGFILVLSSKAQITFWDLWSSVPQFGGVPIRAIAADESGKVYIAANFNNSSVIWYSSNAFKTITGPITVDNTRRVNPNGLKINPLIPNRIYLSTYDGVFPGTGPEPSRLYRSFD